MFSPEQIASGLLPSVAKTWAAKAYFGRLIIEIKKKKERNIKKKCLERKNDESLEKTKVNLVNGRGHLIQQQKFRVLVRYRELSFIFEFALRHASGLIARV